MASVNAHAVVKSIATRHGGGVPEQSGDIAKVALKALIARTDDASHGPRVLIVEDNAQLASYIHSLLQHDYQVRWAEDGDQALTVIHEWAPDLVLSDVMMPKRDGLSLCRELKSKGPSGNKLHSWVSDDGWLWSISMRKTGGIPQVFRGFFALKSAADDRQLTPKCASYFLTGP